MASLTSKQDSKSLMPADSAFRMLSSVPEPGLKVCDVRLRPTSGTALGCAKERGFQRCLYKERCPCQATVCGAHRREGCNDLRTRVGKSVDLDAEGLLIWVEVLGC